MIVIRTYWQPKKRGYQVQVKPFIIKFPQHATKVNLGAGLWFNKTETCQFYNVLTVRR